MDEDTARMGMDCLDATTRITNVRKETLSPTSSDGKKGPSPDFLKRRHERMRGRIGVTKEEAPVSIQIEETKTPIHGTLNAISTAASPTAIRSFRQLRAKRKARVPGGAAAKLIGKTAEAEDLSVATNEEEDEDDAVEIAPPTDEFMKIRDEAKAAFALGPKANTRYHAAEAPMNVTEGQDDNTERKSRSTVGSEGRSVMDRSEAFHKDATTAVLSLLNRPETPKVQNKRHLQEGIPSVSSSRSRDAPPPKDFTQIPAMEVSPRNAFQAPPRKDDTVSSVVSCGSNTRAPSSVVSGTVPTEDLETTTKGRNPLGQPLLTKKAEQRVAHMKEQMRDPNQTLRDLISIVATPDDHVRGIPFTRGYMVRRKNACGALQVLTAKNVHRVQICWTVGILPALGSVLEDSGSRDLSEVILDVHTRREFIEARKRAISSLMNLSVPPENRLAVFHTPRLVSNIVQVINVDDQEGRKGCCAILAHLAKTKENRLLMVQVPGLIDAITSVIEPKAKMMTTQYSDDETNDSDSSHTPDHEFPLRSHSSSDVSAGSPDIVESFMSGEEQIEIGAKETVEVSATSVEDPANAAWRYDGDQNEHLHGARSNVFALFSHLVKEKDNGYILARHKYLTDTLIAISKLHDSPAHEHTVKLLAHLTRHRGNSKHIVFKVRKVVPVLVKASFSQNDESRKYACFALQNLSQDKPCRQELAITEELLTALCVRIRQASDPEERLSAIHALKNLTDEPANLIPMTNTSECFATLMQIAHAGDESVTKTMQYLGCDALATLSHWFRSIATSGQRIDYIGRGLKPSKDLFVPSLKIVNYAQWQ